MKTVVKDNKLCAIISQANEGEAYWQPLNGGCIEMKSCQWVDKDASRTWFLHTMYEGEYVSPHYHEAPQEEVFIPLSGEGELTIDDEVYAMQAGSLYDIKPGTYHGVRNTGKEPLRFMVMITPGGIEERFKEGGQKRTDANEKPPATFEWPEKIRQGSHGVKRD